MDPINLTALVAALLILILYGLYFLYFSKHNADNNKTNLAKRINKSGFSEDNTQENQESISLLKSPTDTYFKSKLPKIEGIKEWLQHAGLDIKPIILIITSIFIGILSIFFFLFILHTNIVIGILLGVISSFLLPWIVITFLTSQRKKKFLEEFPIALDIVRRALRAGHSIDRAINMVVEQLKGPVGQSFKLMVDQLNIGRTFDDVLAEMSNRIGIDDFRMLAIVIVLQRETGGSLAEAIDNFSKIIRARQQLRKKVKALTAEVRVTAMILTAIPFVIFGAVYLTTPTYFNPLFYTDKGQVLLIAGVLMLMTGIGVIVRMTYKETY